MKRSPAPSEGLLPAQGEDGMAESFQPILSLIHQSRFQALQAVNASLVDLYGRIGGYISRKIQDDGWGQRTVHALSLWIRKQDPHLRGFSAQNLWRMRQFYEAYRDDPKLSTLSRVLPWSHNVLVFSRCRSPEERGYYLDRAIQERWPFRELERQINGALFERCLAGKPKLASAMRATHPEAADFFKDRYLVDFLDLPESHTERDLQRALLHHLKAFLLELGRDFCFVGSDVLLQVGNRDFRVDLLFYHRGLQALVAFELKMGPFEPSHLGQLSFYLEALDRDHRKPHEAPSIGVLLCKSRDAEVVEYALNRTLSPALVAEYQTQLPDKGLLQAKLEAFYALASREGEDG